MIGCCVWCILSVYMFYCCMRWKLYRGSHIWIFPFVIWIDWVGNIGWIEALNSDCRFVLSLRSMAKIDVRIEFKPHQRMLNVWWVMMICGVSGVCCVALCMSECEWFYVQCGLYASDVEFKSYCCTTMSILIPLGRQQRQCLYAAADCDFELMRRAIVCYIIKADEQQTKITSTTIVCVCVVLFSIFSDFQCDVESFLPKKTASEQNIIIMCVSVILQSSECVSSCTKKKQSLRITWFSNILFSFAILPLVRYLDRWLHRMCVILQIEVKQTLPNLNKNFRFHCNEKKNCKSEWILSVHWMIRICVFNNFNSMHNILSLLFCIESKSINCINRPYYWKITLRVCAPLFTYACSVYGYVYSIWTEHRVYFSC